jgi:hypothetical protein
MKSIRLSVDECELVVCALQHVLTQIDIVGKDAIQPVDRTCRKCVRKRIQELLPKFDTTEPTQ